MAAAVEGTFAEAATITVAEIVEGIAAVATAGVAEVVVELRSEARCLA